MRIPSDLQKCVVYVGIEAAGRFLPLGTGFLGAVERDGLSFQFVITAQHVIDNINSDTISIRLNRLSGSAESITIPKNRMITHASEYIDIAVFGIRLGADIYDVRLLPLARKHIEQQRERKCMTLPLETK